MQCDLRSRWVPPGRQLVASWAPVCPASVASLFVVYNPPYIDAELHPPPHLMIPPSPTPPPPKPPTRRRCHVAAPGTKVNYVLESQFDRALEMQNMKRKQGGKMGFSI